MVPAPVSGREIGRYSLHSELASGGMATVYVGRLNAPVGFGRIVAIKRLHPQFARDPDFVKMFLDEARLAARIHHPNVVQTLDLVASDGELFVVMDYIRGESLSKLRRVALRTDKPIPIAHLSAIVGGALHGLHAAHEATDEAGQPLGIVHRDVSPQNIIVGADGAARVLDFGVAKAASRLQETRDGQLKGKLSYMAPEQIADGVVTKKTDIYAAGVVLWESLTGKGLFRGDTEGKILLAILEGGVQPPSELRADVPAELDQVVLRALSLNAAERYSTAREMAIALDQAVRGSSSVEVGDWVEQIAGEILQLRSDAVKEIESGTIDSLSGLPRIPAGLLDAPEPTSVTSVSADLLSGASAVRSVVSDAEAPPARRGRLLVAVVLVGLLLAFGWWARGQWMVGPAAETEATSHTAAADDLASAEPSAESTDSPSAVAEAPSAVPTVLEIDAGGAPDAERADAAPPQATTAVQRPPAPVVPRPPKQPKDDDLDSLIESRR